jgi:hypothetical protein
MDQEEIVMTKHGLSRTVEYRRWAAMKERCYSKNNKHYKDYGGRGITVCDRWLNHPAVFIADMGLCPKGFSIDRLDNNLGYSKDNCVWASAKQNANNTRRNLLIEFNGTTKTLSQWAEETGLKRESIKGRLNRGWSIEKALTRKSRYELNACNNGHEFIEGSYTTNGAGKRRCRECQRVYDKNRGH